MNADEPPSMSVLGARVASIQVALAAFCWLGLGLFNARGTWLLEPSQEKMATRLLLMQLPLLGLLGAVIVPLMWTIRLSREAAHPGLLDSDYLVKVLGFPQHAAIAGLVTSVVLFLFAGIELRRTVSIPPLEAAKIGMLGILTGTLLSVLSYFCLQWAVQPLVLHSLERGALAPATPTFPIRKKILSACVAVALLVAGLFGMDAIAWSQRYAEERTATLATRLVQVVSAQAREKKPQEREAWGRLLHAGERPKGAVFYAQGAGGHIVATDPPLVGKIEEYLLRSDFFSSGSHLPAEGSFVSRWGDVRIVSRIPLDNNGAVGVILPPDPSVFGGVLRALCVVTLEAALAALLLAWVSGRGMTMPLRRLALNSEAFGSEAFGADVAAVVPVVTDDEISNLAAAFERMAVARREAQNQLREASRRAERDEVLARVAHEVRNPIFGISSTLSALENEISDPKYDEYFKVLRNEGERLSFLVDEMLGSRSTEGSRTDLVSVLAEAESVVRHRLPNRSFILRSAGTTGEAPSPLERRKATALLACLLESVVLRSRDDAPISLSFARSNGQTVVESRDRGVAISSEGLELVVSRDHEASPWIDSFLECRRIAETVGGEVRIVSSVSGGETVIEIRVSENTGLCNS